ncbi:hypothetical protein PN441_06595 [Spirulina major CS-329]|uniref:hypothetical protein n=1 Tax=Spirulina TaxID=1154 RepID=UPI00232D675B|nr:MULTISPECIES: hypothetical protein [Spirulina]MDB9494687.1 hypothetical protein [Spirulina subsalsa CS-330]MDB9502736.1 hypothetical protein [Spirulina major CS-329]
MISTHQMLAELYDEVGYHQAAQAQYILAHHQSKAENDLIAQATLEQTLGELNVF